MYAVMCTIVVNGNITRLELMDRDPSRMTNQYFVASEGNMDAMTLFTHRYFITTLPYISTIDESDIMMLLYVDMVHAVKQYKICCMIVLQSA